MNIGLSTAIIAITESFLPVGTKDKVLVMAIDARLNFVQRSRDLSAIRGIYIAIYRPTNYTKVIMAEDNEHVPAFSFNKNLPFKYKSDHDSCWRSDGLQSPLFQIKCEMVDELRKKGAPLLPFGQYSWGNYINGLNILPGKIEVDQDKDYKVKLTIY